MYKKKRKKKQNKQKKQKKRKRQGTLPLCPIFPPSWTCFLLVNDPLETGKWIQNDPMIAVIADHQSEKRDSGRLVIDTFWDIQDGSERERWPHGTRVIVYMVLQIKTW